MGLSSRGKREMASFNMSLVNWAFGCLLNFHDTTNLSKQSIMGERYTLPSAVGRKYWQLISENLDSMGFPAPEASLSETEEHPGLKVDPSVT